MHFLISCSVDPMLWMSTQRYVKDSTSSTLSPAMGTYEPGGMEELVIWMLILYQLTWRPRELASWFIISRACVSRESISVRSTTLSAKSRSVKGSVPITVSKKAWWLVRLSSQMIGMRKRSGATTQPWRTLLPIRNHSKTSLSRTHLHGCNWMCWYRRL